MQRVLKHWRPAAAMASGLLLAAAFPPVGSAPAAWLAFVPLLFVAWGSAPPVAFRWGFRGALAGWLVSLSWLLRLMRTGGEPAAVVLAWALLAAYCALYSAAFAALASWLLGTAEPPRAPAVRPAAELSGGSLAEPRRDGRLGRRLALLFGLPLLWVGLEYLRATLASGFAWNLLGVSQYRNTPLIQIAEWGGVYAVSFAVMLMNVALAMTGFRVADAFRGGGAGRGRPVELTAALPLLAALVLWGAHRSLAVARPPAGEAGLRVAAIQPNIAQTEKWSDEFLSHIYRRTAELTRRAAGSLPDLVIWPETAVPYCARTEPATREFVERLADLGAAILAGSMEVESAGGTDRYYNSAMLFLPGRSLAETYRKQHLVPFGEYVPLDHWLPWLRRFAPLGISCTPGSTSTVFRLGDAMSDRRPVTGERPARTDRSPMTDRREPGTVPFSSLICFEDTVAPLARAAVRAGARLLINQTNDAWFEGSSAAVQHMSHCVFRCVENRVPAVRCANLGVTCFIDRTGMIDKMTAGLLQDGTALDVECRAGEVRVPADDMRPTFYTRFGDWPFAIPCAAATVTGLGLLGRRWRRGEWRDAERTEG